MSRTDPFKAKSTFDTGSGTAVIYRLSALEQAGLVKLDRLPFSMRILLENLLRNLDGYLVTEDDVRTLAAWNPASRPGRRSRSCPPASCCRTSPACPCVVDLAAMRDAMVTLGGDPEQINPLVPVDLVIDHSVQVDAFGTRTGAAAQRRAGVRAQPGALRVPEVGPEGLPQLPRRAAGHRHRPPGEPRVPRPRASSCARSTASGRLPRHAGRHRLPHHDDQRPGRAGLGRGRHRGRGGHARPAALHADAPGGRLQADRARCPRASPPPTWC